MDEIDELIWEHNRKWVLEGLQALENDDVDNYTTHMEISDCRAPRITK